MKVQAGHDHCVRCTPVKRLRPTGRVTEVQGGVEW